MMTALIVHETHTDLLFTARLLCEVCQAAPWNQRARWCHALICDACAEGEPAPGDDETDDETQEPQPVPTYDDWVAWAKEEYVSEDIEIDPDTRLSHVGDDLGCWVQAWVFVYNRYADEG